MKRIAIISFCHEESSLCLAKYIGMQGAFVDYYFINNPINKGRVPGFEFGTKYKKWGLHRLCYNDAPEMFNYMDDSKVSINLITYDSDSRRYTLMGLDRLVLWHACQRIRLRHYDAINIVGQLPPVKLCRKFLNGENIIHTIHEIGSHQDGIASMPSIDISICDQSKIILHSRSTYDRYVGLSNVNKKNVTVIPFGKFETNKLYVKSVEMKIPLDLSKPTFLFYGAIRPYKGLDLLRNAIELLLPLQTKFNLIVAGGGADENLEYFRSLSNTFVLNRFLENDEMMHLIQISSVVVLPYHSASQTGIIPTISLYNKPCIATAVGAFPEMVANGINGILIEPENSSAFADAMRQCIENKNMLEKLGLGMSNYGKNDDYDWNVIAKKTIDFMLSKKE